MSISHNNLGSSSLPARLRMLREKNGFTQRQVADFFGLERSTIAKYEAGTSSPSPETLLAFSKIYNVTTDYLIRGDISHSSVSSDNFYHSALPIFNLQNMSDLNSDEQFLVLYFRLLDRDPEILEKIRQEYKKTLE